MKAWKKNIRQVIPYVPGEQPNCADMVKLNTNECPYPPAPGVIAAAKAFEPETLRLYPAFPENTNLVEALAKFYHLKKEQIFVGVGSDDVLANIFLTFFNSDKPILFPNISYSFYSVWADVYRIPYECPALDENFCIRPEDYKKENGGVIFPNPNAPTSIYMPLMQVEEIVAANPDVVVVIDEAYIDFGGQSALSLIDKYDNLLIVQTFSKSRAMAGARIGFAMGNAELIKAMNDVKYSINSYTLNAPSLAMGAAAVEDVEYFGETLAKIVNTREEAKRRLSALGFSFPDSKTNFLFATHKEVAAKEIFEYLKTKNIYVRYFSTPGIDNYLRITIGTDVEMERLYTALEEFLN
ncbi:MAG: histidinol-phosphate transaminase [Lachnospiraceae bacterium]|nr:histidinol-phosphate transaminase [Lachnospiraceae bacterium]